MEGYRALEHSLVPRPIPSFSILHAAERQEDIGDKVM